MKKLIAIILVAMFVSACGSTNPLTSKGDRYYDNGVHNIGRIFKPGGGRTN